MLSHIDFWQLVASASGVLFNFSFMAQLKKTYTLRKVDGLSLSQWAGFSVGSIIFIGFYVHLDQVLMVFVSIFGFACCFSMVIMIMAWRQPARV